MRRPASSSGPWGKGSSCDWRTSMGRWQCVCVNVRHLMLHKQNHISNSDHFHSMKYVSSFTCFSSARIILTILDCTTCSIVSQCTQSNMFTRHSYETHMLLIWHSNSTHVTLILLIWHSYATHVTLILLIWHPYATHMKLICYSYETHMALIWHSFGTHLAIIWHSYGTHMALICYSNIALIRLSLIVLTGHSKLEHTNLQLGKCQFWQNAIYNIAESCGSEGPYPFKSFAACPHASLIGVQDRSKWVNDSRIPNHALVRTLVSLIWYNANHAINT